MRQTAWARLRVDRLTPGATYEGEVFDQTIVVTVPDGTSLELFDMSPMVGAGLVPGTMIDALVAVDAHTGLALGGSDGTVVVPAPVRPENAPTVRPETWQQKWVLLAYRGAVPMLLSEARLADLRGARPGAPVTWRAATYFLMGWR